jgi:hypothetical protein
MAGRSFGAMRGLGAAEGGLYSKIAGQGMESGLFRRIQGAFQRQPGRVMLADENSALE